MRATSRMKGVRNRARYRTNVPYPHTLTLPRGRGFGFLKTGPFPLRCVVLVDPGPLGESRAWLRREPERAQMSNPPNGRNRRDDQRACATGCPF